MAKTRRGKSRTGKTPASEPIGPQNTVKKAVNKPIGQPEKAREEAPIGWVFGAEGPPAKLDDAVAHGPGGASVDGDQLGASPAAGSTAPGVSPGGTIEAAPVRVDTVQATAVRPLARRPHGCTRQRHTARLLPRPMWDPWACRLAGRYRSSHVPVAWVVAVVEGGEAPVTKATRTVVQRQASARPHTTR